jgi:hypothetical protein
VKRSPPRSSSTGLCDFTRSVFRKASRNSLRNSMRGIARPSAPVTASRVTTASPTSCTSEPSELLIARRAVATVSSPRGLNERICGWSISNVSVSG